MKLAGDLRSALMRSSQTFIWSATGLGLFILLSSFVAIAYDSYRSTMRINDQAAANIAALIDQDIARNLDLFDLSLQAVLDGVNNPEVLNQMPRLRQITLFDRSATARGLGALVALDQNGSIFLDSLSEKPRQGNFADREYFIVHRDSQTDIGLYLSLPFRARLQGGIWSISVSRRITRPDGSFGGIVSGTVKLDYFQQLFTRVALGSGGSISLFREDGTLLARNFADDDHQIGSNWQNRPVFARLQHQTRGSFVSDQSIDGQSRLFSFSRVGRFPLTVVVALPMSLVLEPWWSKTIVFSGIFAVMVGSVLLLVWMLEKELRRRAIAETAAAMLARTDGLTKLANRRAFEEGLSSEWLRATRYGHPMSLIMIDVDQFKLFNDTYGHRAGDHALTAIAEVIAQATRRPGDLAGRYGGEEFAILLPDTDRRGATEVAAAIHEGVNRLRIEHTASDHKIVTISAGVATAMLRPGTMAASLVDDADAALYRAKAQGRNAICLGDIEPMGFVRNLSRAS